MKVQLRIITLLIICLSAYSSYAQKGSMEPASIVDMEVQEDSITAQEAEQLALELLEQFITFSRLTGPAGQDYTKKFISLFSVNASIPLDYFEGDRSIYGSPETYVSEYVASGINQPLATSSKLMAKHTIIKKVQGSGDYSVALYLERVKTKTIFEGVYVHLREPIKEIWKIDVTSRARGYAKIHQVSRLSIPMLIPLAIDFAYEVNMANDQLSTGNGTTSIVGLDQMKLGSNNFSLRLNYRFAPFRNPTSEEPVLFYLNARVGIDFTTYTTEALSLSSEVPDYLDNDGVYMLINAPDSLNDGPLAEGTGDFILHIADDFEEEVLKVATLNLMLGGGYQLTDKFAFELGLGRISSASGEIGVRSDYSRYATFSEGYFEDNPVTIYPENASFALQSEVLSFDDYGDAYGLNNGAEEIKFKSKTESAMYLELKLIRLFNVRDFALGATVSMRSLLGNPLIHDSQGNVNLQDVALSGVPRLIAFTENYSPLYVGFGIRIQKR